MPLRQQAAFLVALVLTSIVLEVALAHDWGPEATGWSVAAIFGAAFLINARFSNHSA
jgi:hypothetical protein